MKRKLAAALLLCGLFGWVVGPVGAQAAPLGVTPGHYAGAAPLAAAAGSQSGFTIAWLVMALMAASMLYSLVGAALASRMNIWRLPSTVSVWLIPLLCVIGLGVAGYLTFVETQNVAAVCGPVGDCNAVQSSPYARLFGVIPVGLLGLAGYLAIVAAWGARRFTRGRLAELAPVALFGMALFGVLFSVYLTFLELFVINAVCAWCLTSAAILALLLFASLGGAIDSLAVEYEDEAEGSEVG